jgi:hypothetical protein
MSKRPATHANAVVVDGSGDNAAFAGIGAVGESDDTTLVPNTRDSRGYPVGITTFSGNNNDDNE